MRRFYWIVYVYEISLIDIANIGIMLWWPLSLMADSSGLRQNPIFAGVFDLMPYWLWVGAFLWSVGLTIGGIVAQHRFLRLLGMNFMLGGWVMLAAMFSMVTLTGPGTGIYAILALTVFCRQVQLVDRWRDA